MITQGNFSWGKQMHMSMNDDLYERIVSLAQHNATVNASPTVPTKSADFSVGELRPVFFKDDRDRPRMRYVMIVSQPSQSMPIVGAMLIHEHPEMMTDDDVRLYPSDIGYPIDGALQSSNLAPVLDTRLGPPVAVVPPEIASLAINLSSGGRLDGTRTGPRVFDEMDPRVRFADSEWTTMQMIASSAFAWLEEEDSKVNLEWDFAQAVAVEEQYEQIREMRRKPVRTLTDQECELEKAAYERIAA